MIEDFIPTKWKKKKLGNKTLNLNNTGLDTSKEYGKALFAEHVVKKNKTEIDFIELQPILDRIAKVIEDYEKKTS